MNSLAVQIIDAGPFGAWLKQIREALQGHSGMHVPCGECVGCCISHYSILLRPHDAALDIVPAALLSSVPGQHYPHAKLNPRSDGTCQMFIAGRCSIYAQRPQTCLDYDCRVFAAAGIEAGPDKPVINQRVQAWRFSYEDESARNVHMAIKAAADFLRQYKDAFPQNWAPTSPSGIAVTALKVYELFMDQPCIEDIHERIAAIMNASKLFNDTANT